MKSILTLTLLVATLLAWTGCENKEDNEASKLLISKLLLKKFPATKAEGVPWDISNYSEERLADLRLQILIDSVSYWPGVVYEDARNYYYYEFPFEAYLIGDADETFTFVLYDFDGSTLTSDIITRLTFKPIDILEGYPQSFTVKNNDCTFEIYADYIF